MISSHELKVVLASVRNSHFAPFQTFFARGRSELQKWLELAFCLPLRGRAVSGTVLPPLPPGVGGY